MLTIQALRDWGANTDEGLSRCMNNEAFYLRLVGMLKNDQHFEQLETALAAGDTAAGFEAAHALKGVLANLALTPALTPVSAITELLRARQPVTDPALMDEARSQMARLRELLA